MLPRLGIYNAYLHDYLADGLAACAKQNHLHDKYDEERQQREDKHNDNCQEKPGINIRKVEETDTGNRKPDHQGNHRDYEIGQTVEKPSHQPYPGTRKLARRLFRCHFL